MKYLIAVALFVTALAPGLAHADFVFFDTAGTAQEIWRGPGTGGTFQGTVVDERAPVGNGGWEFDPNGGEGSYWNGSPGSTMGGICGENAAAAGLTEADDVWCAIDHNVAWDSCYANTGGPGGETCSNNTNGGGESGINYTFGEVTTTVYLMTSPPNAGSGSTESCEATGYTNGLGFTDSCFSFQHEGVPEEVVPAAIAGLSASPLTVVSGNTTALTYSCANATSGSIDNGVGAITADGVNHTVPSGQLTATATTTVNFILTCVGDGGNDSATATVTVTPAPPANRPPVGSIDGVDNTACTVSGWAQDPDVPSTAIDVHLYAGGPAGAGGVFMGSITAGASRADLCPTYGCNHGFTYAVPSTYKDGVARTVYAYGINQPAGTNPPLSNSGSYSIQCAAPASQADLRPTGFSPNIVVSGVPSTFTGTVSNDGATATGPFNSRAYVCLQSDTDCQTRSYLAGGESQGFFARIRTFFQGIAHAAAASPVLTLSRITAGLAGNAQNVPQTVSYAFPANTAQVQYAVKYCVDNPAPQEVAESDETDNCGSWQVLTVCPEGYSVSGSSCVPPTPSGALSCTINDADGTVTVPPGGTVSVTYTASGGSAPITWDPSDAAPGAYGTALTATRVFGSSNIGNSYDMEAQKSGYTAGNCPLVTVTDGTPVCPGTDTGTLTASPNRVQAETETPIAFSYRGNNVSTSCVLSGPDFPAQTFTPNACTVGPGTVTQSISIPTQSTYTLTCDGTQVAEAIVNVVPTIIEP